MKNIKCDLSKCTSSGSKGYALVVDLEYPKELWGFHNYYPLAPDKREIKREMLPNYQLKIADLYNISIGNIKKLVLKLFDKENMWFIMKILIYLRLGLKLIKIHYVLEFNQSQWLKQYVEFNTQKE